MSSLANHATRFDTDVARVHIAFLRSRKIIAAIQRARDTYKRGQRRDNLLWQQYLKQHWRRARRRREAWLFKLLLRSLALLVIATCRALGSGAIWLLSYSGRLILVRSTALMAGAPAVPLNSAETRGTKLVKLGPAAAIAAAALITVGLFAPSKSISPIETVLAVQPAPHETATFTAAKGKLLQERIGTTPSPSTAPRSAPIALSTEAAPQPVPGSGRDVSGLTLPKNTLPTPEPSPGIRDVTPAASPEPQPQSRSATPSAILPKMPATQAAPQQTASAMRKPLAEKPATRSEPPQRRTTNEDRGLQQRAFVPHTSW